MNTFLSTATRLLGRGRAMKLLFNLSPMYRATGGRLMEVSDDLHYVKIKLSLNYRTRNYVGTLYGGHMYSCVDGIYMVQLINILGKDFVVWDKSASIRFRRPGDRRLFAEFRLNPEYIESIKAQITEKQEMDFHLTVDLVDAEGKVYAEVEKVIFIADKAYFREKRAKRNST